MITLHCVTSSKDHISLVGNRIIPVFADFDIDAIAASSITFKDAEGKTLDDVESYRSHLSNNGKITIDSADNHSVIIKLSDHCQPGSHVHCEVYNERFEESFDYVVDVDAFITFIDALALDLETYG